jgi:orotate phosphoribosyltransferase/AMMECR1 domain-containing protein
MRSALPSRERLRRLMQSDAILHRSARRPIVDRLGRPMPWILYSWAVTLSPRGESLVAECLLDALRRFDSVQIAGVGMTGLPLVSSVVSRGNGRYSGLYVRSERETWGTRRQVEGVADKARPVVVVDDCVCSGRSLRFAFRALEDEGYRVEGALCLVGFPWQGGVEWAQALGFRIETIFDAWTDLQMLEHQEVPTYRDVTTTFDAKTRVPEGLSPADAAHWVAMRVLQSGMTPKPPASFDRSYDAAGGVMVSFRDRVSDHRLARSGFYHLRSADASLGRDVVLATVKTVESSREAMVRHGLARLKVAVTLFGKQIRSSPSELDFDRFGVLVQSEVRPGKLAAALPNTQFFVSEMQQFRHARFTNARLFRHEPYRLFRHAVSKSIETDCAWLSFGVPAEDENGGLDGLGDMLIARARAVILAMQQKRPPGVARLNIASRRIHGLAVTIYDHGMIGCWTSFQGSTEAMLFAAATGAWNDRRWRRRAGISPANIAIVVSIFQRAEVIGEVGIETAAFRLRLGKDSLVVRQEGKSTILLSYIACHNSWTKEEMVAALLRKGGISNPPYHWTTYSTRSWLSHGGSVTPLVFGYPSRDRIKPACAYRATANLIARYILGKLGKSGLPEYCYNPVSDRRIVSQSAPRIILALDALIQAGQVLEDPTLRKSALKGLRYCCAHITTHQGVVRLDLPEILCGTMAEAFLVNAIYRCGERSLIDAPATRKLVLKLRNFFHADGAITWEAEGRRLSSDHDLFPGSLLRTAASVAAEEGLDRLPSRLEEHLAWYQRRFRLLHPWGMVFWQTQGWAAVYRLTETQPIASFVYELIDWACEHQLRKNGAFLVDYDPEGPDFRSACVLEALADAWLVADSRAERRRARRYQLAWTRGFDFVERLIIRDADTFAMRDPSRSIGGVRESLVSSITRIDYAAHTLLALAKGLSVGLIS